MAEDRITAVNGEKVLNDMDIAYSLIRDQDGIVSMDIVRDGEKLHLDPVVFSMQDAGNGGKAIILDFQVYGTEPTFGRSVSYAFGWTWSLVKLVWHSLGDIVRGEFALNQLSGPIGLTETISEVASSANIDGLLLVLALVTVNLGVFNILPLPALDGGRIFFMVLELIFGKPVNKKVEAVIHTVGFAALMALSLFVAVSDVIRIVTGG